MERVAGAAPPPAWAQEHVERHRPFRHTHEHEHRTRTVLVHTHAHTHGDRLHRGGDHHTSPYAYPR